LGLAVVEASQRVLQEIEARLPEVWKEIRATGLANAKGED
jgi:hypothetical protein